MQSVKESPVGTIHCISNAGLSVHVTTVEASIASAISQTMFSNNSDLLILNSAQHGWWWNLIGESTTVSEIKESPFSLLIMREPL
jgi:nucleotide-binding universal stress UspA family protein